MFCKYTNLHIVASNVDVCLQTYERLTLLVDRIALPNLISRVSQGGLSSSEMQILLTRSLKEEFEYNISQQIYVSPMPGMPSKT